MGRLIVRSLLTAVGWGVGAMVLGWAFVVAERFQSQGFDAGMRALRSLSLEPEWFALGAVAGALFTLVAAGLRATGRRASASRRTMAFVGAAAMVPAVVALTVAMGGPPFDLFIALPPLGLLAVAIGAVLGWCPLAVGAARE